MRAFCENVFRIILPYWYQKRIPCCRSCTRINFPEYVFNKQFIQWVLRVRIVNHVRRFMILHNHAFCLNTFNKQTISKYISQQYAAFQKIQNTNKQRIVLIVTYIWLIHRDGYTKQILTTYCVYCDMHNIYTKKTQKHACGIMFRNPWCYFKTLLFVLT